MYKFIILYKHEVLKYDIMTYNLNDVYGDNITESNKAKYDKEDGHLLDECMHYCGIFCLLKFP